MDKKIFVIDDDPLVLRTFQSLLTKSGYAVVVADSYDSALKIFKNENFDLVLSDIRMPGKNGVETVADIQESLKKAGKKDLPIIFITGYSKESIQVSAEFYGEILSKPVDAEHLLLTVREYL